MAYSDIIRASSAALQKATTAPIHLAFDEAIVDYPGAAAVLLRASLRDRPPELPASVVIKRVNAPAEAGMEFAGLAFTNELAGMGSLVPRLLAADIDERLIVMEDLSGDDARRLGDLLFGADGDAAVRALHASQAALARFNAAGFGERPRLERILAGLGGARPSRHAVHRLDALLADLPSVVGEYLPRPVSPRLADELRLAGAHLFDPGPFITATHGDPTVGNVLVTTTGRIRMLDLETVAYRHALIDGSFARLRYVHSVWANRIPLTLQRQLLTTYRTELAKACPQAADDQMFGRALVAACAAWLAALCSHLERVTDRDLRWGRATYRQRIATALADFVTVADEYGRMPVLRDTADQLHERLREVWPSAQRELPIYPALLDVGTG